LSLTDLSTILESHLGKELTDIIKDNPSIQQETLTVSKWYKKEKDRDGFLSMATNIFVGRMMKFLPNEFSSILLTNIKIQTKGAKKGSLNSAFALPPLKPYIECIQKINGVKTSSLKITFQINSVVTPLNLTFDNDYKKVAFSGMLMITISLILNKLSALEVHSDIPLKLGDRSFQIDLSGIHV